MYRVPTRKTPHPHAHPKASDGNEAKKKAAQIKPLRIVLIK